MKNVIYLLLAAIFFVACHNDTNYNYQGTMSGGDDGVALISCNEAIYPDQENSLYILPYEVGKTYMVNLNHCSSSYHAPGSPDQFAVDFDMPIGSQVRAARSGTVVFVEEGGADGGFPNNLVVIRHEDNTHAAYMHLTQNGATVEVGFGIGQGSLIGFSGNTGLAGYPHLHFVVIGEDIVYPYSSLPYNFKNTIPNPKGPMQGLFYEALPF